MTDEGTPELHIRHDVTIRRDRKRKLGCLGWLALLVVIALPASLPLHFSIPMYLVEGLLLVAYIAQRLSQRKVVK